MSSGLFELTKAVWTQITTTDKSGKVLHLSGDPSVVYMQSPVQPVGYDKTTPTSQSTIARNFFMYSEMATEDFLWAYSVNSDAVISVTPSDGAILNTDTLYFTGLRAINTQNYIESNIKLGVQHEGSTILEDVPSLGVNDTIFLTGALPVALKSRNVGYTGTGVSTFIYEAPTYTGGTSAPYQNPNAMNPVTGLAQIIVGATVTVDGTLIFAPEHLLGPTSQQAKGSGVNVLGQEKILQPNTAYLFRLTSLDPQIQDITSLLSWYEGELDLPLP